MFSAVGLGADVIASSFGKAARSLKDTDDEQFKKEDIARSLLLSISNDIGQIAYLQVGHTHTCKHTHTHMHACTHSL